MGNINDTTTSYWAVTQGLPLRFQARGPKRSFDKDEWSKAGFLVIIHTVIDTTRIDESIKQKTLSIIDIEKGTRYRFICKLG